MSTVAAGHKHIVEKAIQRLIRDSKTQQIFLTWPNLVSITERFCYFVSPLIPATNGEPLFHFAIRQAIVSYGKEPDAQYRARAYVLTLVNTTAETLSGLEVQSVNPDNVVVWEPFVEPMTTWMVRNNIRTIRTATAQNTLNARVAKLSLLTQLVPAQEIESMGLLPRENAF